MSTITSSPFLATSPSQSALEWFELIFFALTVPVLLIAYLAHRPIPGGRLGWFFLLNFSLMRAVGFILLKAANSRGVFIAGTVISGASLSPLYFGTSGVWHEVAHWRKHKNPTLYGWKMQIVIHLMVGAAIGMAIAGSVTQITSKTGSPSYSRPLQIAGISLLLVVWVGLCILLIKIWEEPVTQLEKRLLFAVGLALPLLFVRTIYSLCGAAIDDSTWSYYQAPLAAQVIMQVLADCLIILIYSAAGLATRMLKEERLDNAEKQSSLTRERRQMKSTESDDGYIDEV